MFDFRRDFRKIILNFLIFESTEIKVLQAWKSIFYKIRKFRFVEFLQLLIRFPEIKFVLWHNLII